MKAARLCFLIKNTALLPSAVPKKGSNIPVITVVIKGFTPVVMSVIFSICRIEKMVHSVESQLTFTN